MPLSSVRRALAAAALLVALPVPADGAGAAHADPADPTAGWSPPRVKHEGRDQQEIHRFFVKMEDAARKGDLAAASALIDFPVLMVTDDSKGEATSVSWDRERWEKEMAPFYAKPMPIPSSHTPTVFLVTDSLAMVGDRWTLVSGKRKLTGRNATLLVRKDGAWKAKAMVEGGWGDVPSAADAAPAAGGTPTPAAGATP